MSKPECDVFIFSVLFVVAVICLVIGGIFGLSNGNCDCPYTFQNSTVTRVNSYRSFSCLIVDNSTVVNVNKICGRYDNYEVAIGFFGLGIFIVVVFILFIFYNLFIFYDLKCCRKPSVKPPNPKPPVYDQEFRAIHKPELDQEFRANPYEPPYKPNDKYADIQVV